MLKIDPDAGGRALFEMAFQSKTPLWPTWEDQPQSLRDEMARRAMAIYDAVSGDTTSSRWTPPPPMS